MDVNTVWFHKFTRFHTFKQELANDGQKYYFSVNLKKWSLFLASSAIITLGIILGLIVFPSTFSYITLLEPYILQVIVILVGSLLIALSVLLLPYTVYLIATIPRMIKLQKFTLTLKKGEVLVCEKLLTIPEKLAIRIRVHDSILQSLTTRQDLATKLMFEPLELSPFSQLSKIEKHLSYHEKRKLAEQLSSNLKIKLIDMLSSFEPGIYENNENLAEKLKLTKLEQSNNLKLATSKNVHSIQLPYEKETIFWLIVNPILIMLLVNLNYLILLLPSNVTRGETNFSFAPIIYASLFFPLFLPIILRKSIRSKVVVNEDSISLISQNIWGTRGVFCSSLNELKDISIIPDRNNSSQILLRSDKLTVVTYSYPRKAINTATTTINNLLLNRFENTQVQ